MSHQRERTSSWNSGEEPSTPPDSPRKRRRQNRFSEENAGEKPINAFLAEVDSYRRGAPDIPRLMPLFNVPIKEGSQFITRSDELRQATIEVLDRYEIPYTSIGGYNRTTGDGEKREAKETIVVYALQDSTASWGPAAQECAGLYKVKGFPQLQIEILHPEKFHIAHKHPFPDTHQILEKWDWATVGQAVLAAVRQHLSSLWCSVGVYYYGKTLETSNPTLLITVDENATADWVATGSVLEKILDEHQIGQAVGLLQVEFKPGYISLAEGQVMALDDLPPQAAVGSSIGIENEEDGGTMGGYVVLRKGNERIYCALTTHHVVLPSDPALEKRHDDKGITIGQTDQSTATTIVYPCKSDLEATASNARLILNDAQSELAKVQKEINEGLDSRQNQLKVFICNRDINLQQPILARCQALRQQPVLGKVIASSGKRLPMPDGSLMDWALIRLANQSFNSNSGYLVDQRMGFRFRLDPNLPIIETGDLELQGVYAKKGRTTGVTIGRVNQIQQLIKWSKEGESNVETLQWEIIPVSENTDIRGFADIGDSGAFVMDQERRIVALLFALWQDQTTGNSGIVIPIEEVFDDIQKQNPGWTVGLP
ncbi:MAG: hypothetical protein M1812_007161 [Candelaria pacifica]|nr:MAG: hypothetical protein M1812_007161 [Candelaria pacifica]